MELVEEYKDVAIGGFSGWDERMTIESKLRELLQPSESGEVEDVYSVLYTLYSVAYTHSDINVSDKGKDAMMKASKLLDRYYSKKDKNETIIEMDVSDKPTQELQSMRDMFESQGYSTCIQVYEGLVDTYVLEVYE